MDKKVQELVQNLIDKFEFDLKESEHPLGYQDEAYYHDVRTRGFVADDVLDKLREFRDLVK